MYTQQFATVRRLAAATLLAGLAAGAIARKWLQQRYGISREAQDEYALSSQQRTAAAQEAGRFDDEIVPLPSTQLVKDKATKETFNDDECERLLRGFLTPALFEAGLYCRADDRGDPVVQLAPPLISGQAEFDAIYDILRNVLTEASARM